MTSRTTVSARDLVIQALILALGLGLQLTFGFRWDLGLDEWWHVYFAEVAPFSEFRFEIQKDTHPPLHYLLMRPITSAGMDPIWARLVSILPGALSIPLLFVVLRGSGLAVPVAHLGALALAISHIFVSMGVCIRSYSLATFFTLLAMIAWADILRDPAKVGRWKMRLFLAGCLLGPWFAYSAGFATVALLVTPWLFAIFSAAYRASLKDLLRRTKPIFSIGLLILGLVALSEYDRRARRVDIKQHLNENFPQSDEAAGAYVLRGLDSNLADFVGFDSSGDEVWPAVAFAVFLLLALVCAWRAGGGAARVQVGHLIVLVILLMILIVCGLQGLYPWGGKIRHQYVIFPSLILALLILVNGVYRALPTRAGAVWIGFAAAAAIALSTRSYSGPSVDEFAPRKIWGEEYARLRERLEPGAAIYVTRFNQLGFYASSRDEGGWELSEVFGVNREEIKRFRASVKGGLLKVYLRRHVWEAPSFSNGDFVRLQRALIERERREELWVLDMRERGRAMPADREAYRRAQRAAFETEGLVVVDHLWFKDGEAYALRRSPRTQ